jgi:hypothetical protein
MEPISIIISALAAGAVAGIKPTAEKAIKDAYEGLKALIQRKYAKVDLKPLEAKPDSKAKQESVKEDLESEGAAADQELFDRAGELIALLKRYESTAAASIGVDLREVEAAFLKIQSVKAAGTGVRIEKGKFSGGIEIGPVESGNGAGSPNG